MDLEIESADVIKVILQFLKENQLEQSFQTLQKESQVSFNVVNNTGALISAIKRGKWDVALAQISTLQLPYHKLANVYEQIILELLEVRELETARAILNEGKGDNAQPENSQITSVLRRMRLENADRFFHLEKLLSLPHFDSEQFYGEGNTKEKRRQQIATEISEELQTAPASRLLTLVTQALRYQQLQGALPAGQQYDLFRQVSHDIVQPELYPERLHGVMKFAKTSHPLSVVFTPDGQSVVTGSVDGFIEIWNFLTCKVRTDISFQASNQFMIHKAPVFCLNFSKDGTLLVSADSEGNIKLWEFDTGKCLVNFRRVHQSAVMSVHLSAHSNKVLSCSKDETVRIHGRNSKQTLTILRGHTSFVNDCCWSKDESNVISCSSDGTVKVWNVANSECILSFNPGQGKASQATVNNVVLAPFNTNALLVCNRSNKIGLFSLADGQLISVFEDENNCCDFVKCITSPKGNWVLGLTQKGHLLCFNSASKDLEHKFEADSAEPTGMAHHPHRNLLATFTQGNIVKIWKPSPTQISK